MLVDHRDQLDHLGAAALRHLELEGAGDMQRLEVEHPGERQLIVRPLPAHEDGDLVLAGALERPLVGRRHTLDHVKRIAARRYTDVDGWSWHRGLTRDLRADEACSLARSASVETGGQVGGDPRTSRWSVRDDRNRIGCVALPRLPRSDSDPVAVAGRPLQT